ncbi:hypothetical protein QUF90_11670 [Desulfococcaceae bacterium HSG9]|nr:hypothetical protein [Desulfococcaceae bacterium HSG9]
MALFEKIRNTLKSDSAYINASDNEKRAKLDDAVYKHFARTLEQTMATHNLPGFDLYEFRQIFKNACAQGRSERQAVQLALSASETLGVNKSTLIENYDYYLKTFQEARQRFLKDIKTSEHAQTAANTSESPENHAAEMEASFNRAYENFTSKLTMVVDILKNSTIATD